MFVCVCVCLSRRLGAVPPQPGGLTTIHRARSAFEPETTDEMGVECVCVCALVALADCRRQIEMDAKRFCWSTKPFYL